MSLTDEQSARMKGIAARAKAMLLTPKAEWEVIDREAATVRGLYVGYVMIMAAIPAICAIIGGIVFSGGSRWAGIVISPITVVVGGIVSYLLSLASVFVIGLLIEAIAPSFGGPRGERMQAMKVAAYFPTAAWIAGVFNLIPALAILTILGLYSLYLLYLGLPRLMRVGQEKALVFTIVVCLLAIVVEVIIAVIVGAARMALMPVAPGGLY